MKDLLICVLFDVKSVTQIKGFSCLLTPYSCISLNYASGWFTFSARQVKNTKRESQCLLQLKRGHSHQFKWQLNSPLILSLFNNIIYLLCMSINCNGKSARWKKSE